MRAIKRGVSFYEVSDGDRWWTVSGPTESGWGICNERLQAVNPDGRLGKKIISACNIYAPPNGETSQSPTE